MPAAAGCGGQRTSCSRHGQESLGSPAGWPGTGASCRMDWGRLEAGVLSGSEVREPGWSGAWQEGEGVADLSASSGSEGRRHRVKRHFQAFSLVRSLSGRGSVAAGLRRPWRGCRRSLHKGALTVFPRIHGCFYLQGKDVHSFLQGPGTNGTGTCAVYRAYLM